MFFRIVNNYHHFWLDINTGNEPVKNMILDKLVANPVHVFQLLCSFKLLDESIKSLEQSNRVIDVQNFLKKLNIIKEFIGWPTNEDLKGAIHGLLRIQYTYQLPIGTLHDSGTKNLLPYISEIGPIPRLTPLPI